MTLYKGNTKIGTIYHGSTKIGKLYKGSTLIFQSIKYYTLTINATPADATVVLTAAGYVQSGNSITVAEGTVVSYSVSKTGYTTSTGSQTVTRTNTISIALTAATTDYSYSISCYDVYGTAYGYINDVAGLTAGKVVTLKSISPSHYSVALYENNYTEGSYITLSVGTPYTLDKTYRCVYTGSTSYGGNATVVLNF